MSKRFFLKSSRTNNCQVNDRANIYDMADNRYHWVARPKQLNDIHDLNIPHILPSKKNYLRKIRPNIKDATRVESY
jgi:hypothetical protein